MKHITVIIPVYNSNSIVPVLVDQVVSELYNVTDSFELLMIDDGSSDDSWQSIKNMCIKYTDIRGIRLSKNVGQHNAIRAGIENVNSDWTIIMDCDLQDNPAELSHIYHTALNKYEIVLADRRTKKGRLFYKISSWKLNKILSILIWKRMNYRTGNFGIYSSKAIYLFKQLPFRNFYLPVAARVCNLTLQEINVMHQPRYAGKSTYTFTKQIKLALSAILFALIARYRKKAKPIYVIAEIIP